MTSVLTLEIFEYFKHKILMGYELLYKTSLQKLIKPLKVFEIKIKSRLHNKKATLSVN